MTKEPVSVPGYRLGELRAAGASGEVYRAERIADEAQVIIKVFDAEALDPASLRLTLKTASVLAEIRHPNFVQLMSVVTEGAAIAVVLEHVEGRLLRELVREGPMTVRRSLSLCEDIANAVSELHRRGISHGDVKPENVIVRPNGTAVLIDPPLPVFSGTKGRFLTTPRYASPEVLAGHAAPNAASDVYALGKVLIELLTTQVQPVRAYERLASAAQGVTLQQLLRRMTSESPRERPNAVEVAQTCADLQSSASESTLDYTSGSSPEVDSYTSTFVTVEGLLRRSDTARHDPTGVAAFLEQRSRIHERRQLLLSVLAMFLTAAATLTQATSLFGQRVWWSLAIVAVASAVLLSSGVAIRYWYRRGLVGRVLQAHAPLAVAYSEALEASLVNPDLDRRLAHGGIVRSVWVSVAAAPGVALALDVDASEDWL